MSMTMVKLIVFIVISIFYVMIAKFASYDVAILCAVTTLMLFELERRIDE